MKTVIVAVGIVYTPIYARLTYGQTLSVKENDYVENILKNYSLFKTIITTSTAINFAQQRNTPIQLDFGVLRQVLNNYNNLTKEVLSV